MKKLYLNILGVSALLALVGGTAYGIGANSNNKSVSNDDNATLNNNTIRNEATNQGIVDASKVFKDETVYAVVNPDGSTKKVIVNDELKNTQSGILEDSSCLTGILNLKGNETPTINGENVSWNAQGKDIYYQGYTDKVLPITINVTYKLNGETIDISDEIAKASNKDTKDQCKLIGKDGKLEMHYSFINNAYVESVDKYVPFVVLGGTIVPSANFKNVEVDHGQAIQKGSKTFITGYALPKLQEDLGIDSSLLPLPEDFTIKADVTDFSMETFVTYADSSLINTIASATKDVSLDDATTATLKKIYNITSSLNNGDSDLYTAFTNLLTQEQTLKTGLDKLSNGVDELNSGVTQLVAYNESLSMGVEKTFNGLLKQATDGIKAKGLDIEDLTIKNYNTVLTGIVNNITQQVKQGVHAQVEQGVTAEVRKQVLAGVLEATGMTSSGVTVDNYDELCENGTITSEQKSGIDAAVENKMNEDSTKQTIADNTEAQYNSESVQKQQSALVSEKTSPVQSVLDSLESYNTFYTGLNTYLSKVQLIKDNLPTLVDGVDELKTKLLGVCDQLDNITKNFTEEDCKNIDALIAQITPYTQAGIANQENIMETVKLAQEYINYSGINSESNGAVKFIYRADSLVASK